jgi:hypothetical protein
MKELMKDPVNIKCGSVNNKPTTTTTTTRTELRELEKELQKQLK